MINKEIEMNNEHELTLRITAVNHAMAAIEVMGDRYKSPEEFWDQVGKIHAFYKESSSSKGNVISLGSVN